METENLETVSKFYAFDDWRGTNLLDSDGEARNLDIPSGLVPDLDDKRVRVIDPGDGTRLIRATWQAEDGEGVHKLDIRECQSRDDAHRVVLELLANMQSPKVERLGKDRVIGDVAFAHDSSWAVVFARANVAVRVDSASAKGLSADEIARVIDNWIIENTSPEGSPDKDVASAG